MPPKKKDRYKDMIKLHQHKTSSHDRIAYRSRAGRYDLKNTLRYLHDNYIYHDIMQYKVQNIQHVQTRARGRSAHGG